MEIYWNLSMTNYFRFSDQNIFKARGDIKSLFGENIYDFIDHYPLFACPQTMLRYSFILSLLEDIKTIPGDICEFGTWKGATAIYIAKMLDEIEPQSSRKIIVFDNFSGLPQPNEINDGAKSFSTIGLYKGDLESMQKIISIFDLEHRIEIIQGDANKTIPEYFHKKNPTLISLAYFDFDFYDPTKTGWEYIKNRLFDGSLLVFDEGLNKDEYIGEYLAMKEIIDECRGKYTIKVKNNCYSRQPQVVLKVKDTFK